MNGSVEQPRTARRTAVAVAAITLVALTGIVVVADHQSSPRVDVAEAGTDAPSAATPVATTPPATTPFTTTPTDTTSPALGTGTASVATVTTSPLPPLPCPPARGAAQVTAFPSAPPSCIDPEAIYRAVLTTTAGRFTVLLDTAHSPETVNNFVYLARYRFYDGLPFHRVVPGFVIQTGDPTGTGTGGPGYSISGELPATPGYPIGAVAMAAGDPARPTGNASQFFIVIGRAAEKLPPSFPLLGMVTEGLDVVRGIGAPDGATVTVTDATVTGPTGTAGPAVITIERVEIVATGEKTSRIGTPRTSTTLTTITTTTTTPTLTSAIETATSTPDELSIDNPAAVSAP